MIFMSAVDYKEQKLIILNFVINFMFKILLKMQKIFYQSIQEIYVRFFQSLQRFQRALENICVLTLVTWLILKLSLTCF